MTALRHLDYGPGHAVTDIGAAGIQAILDGQDVDGWQPLLRAVRTDPWGPVADRIEQVSDHLESYGTSAAMRAWLSRCRAGLEQPARTLSAHRVRQGLSQAQVAGHMGVSQAQVARLESSSNPTSRSVGRYLDALDMRPVAIIAAGENGATVITWPS
ncbi:hypothetical protein BH24ACT15_BH24ACT15_14900 [soil metagenome]|jgi:DNA-binding transcriptional regulator YiaG